MAFKGNMECQGDSRQVKELHLETMDDTYAKCIETSSVRLDQNYLLSNLNGNGQLEIHCV